MVECCIEDANNLRRFIIDDGVELLIPEDRDCKPTSRIDYLSNRA